MAKMQTVCDDDDAAKCLAQGHPKTGTVGQAWGMRDRSADGHRKVDAAPGTPGDCPMY